MSSLWNLLCMSHSKQISVHTGCISNAWSSHMSNGIHIGQCSSKAGLWVSCLNMACASTKKTPWSPRVGQCCSCYGSTTTVGREVSGEIVFDCKALCTWQDSEPAKPGSVSEWICVSSSFSTQLYVSIWVGQCVYGARVIHGKRYQLGEKTKMMLTVSQVARTG